MLQYTTKNKLITKVSWYLHCNHTDDTACKLLMNSKMVAKSVLTCVARLFQGIFKLIDELFLCYN